MAFDWGGRRIGVAVSQDGRMVFPREHIEVADDASALTEVSKLITEEKIQSVVVGLPISLDGKENAMAGRIRAFGEQIVSSTGIPVMYEDERLSTKEAEKKRLPGSRVNIDSLAAQVVLENFLAK